MATSAKQAGLYDALCNHFHPNTSIGEINLKLNTCKQCGHVFVSKRIRPFCNNECRHNFMANNPLPAILIGANTNDQGNIE